MLRIEFKQRNIVLFGDIIDDWEHNMFLTVNLGFNEDYTTNGIYYPFSENGFWVLDNLISYLKSKNLSYEVDETIDRFIQTIQTEKKLYNIALNQVAQPEEIAPPNRMCSRIEETSIGSISSCKFSHSLC